MGASVLGQCAQHRAKLVCFCVIINASYPKRIIRIAERKVSAIIRRHRAMTIKVQRARAAKFAQAERAVLHA